MNNQIITYSIPTNPNIIKGSIYTLYINNNKNLDLTSILKENNITLNNIITPFKENKIILEKNDYDKLTNITKQIQNLVNSITKYQEEINKNITELSKLNSEHDKLLKNITSERKI